MSNELLVEFVGLPGSGKTTISRIVANLLQHEGIPAELSDSTRIIRLKQDHRFYRTLLSIRSIRILINAIWVYFSIKPWNMETFSRCLAFHKYELFNVTSGSHIILDQGIVQDVYSAMFMNKISNFKSTRALWRKFTRSRIDALVIVECSPDEAARRISERVHGQSRLDDMDADQARSQLVASQPLLEKLALECAEEQGSRILILNSADSPIANAAKVAHLIKSYAT